jgi:hypothetical protein
VPGQELVQGLDRVVPEAVRVHGPEHRGLEVRDQAWPVDAHPKVN